MKNKINSWDSSVAFRFIWGIVGNAVTASVKADRAVFVPNRGFMRDYLPSTAARILLRLEVGLLSRKIREESSLLDDGITGMAIPDNWNALCLSSCEVMGIDAGFSDALSSAAFIDAMEWKYASRTLS